MLVTTAPFLWEIGDSLTAERRLGPRSRVSMSISMQPERYIDNICCVLRCTSQFLLQVATAEDTADERNPNGTKVQGPQRAPSCGDLTATTYSK